MSKVRISAGYPQPCRGDGDLLTLAQAPVKHVAAVSKQRLVGYYWAAMKGTERSIGFAAKMRQEGFERFEEAIDEFRVRFDDRFLRGR